MTPRDLTARSARLVHVALCGLAVARIARAARVAPALQRTLIDALPTISIVIPARNEAHRIEPCLAGAMSALHVQEVLVVDDGSTDGTAELASTHGARVVPAGPLPSGWAGKAWALDVGLRAATGEWVVNLDADVEPSPDLAAAVVGRAIEEGCGVLSVAGRFVCDSPGERWLHPSMLTTLVVRFGPPGAASRPERVMANGQCLAYRRKAVLADGGWAPVRGHLVEDVAFVRHRAASGDRTAFVDGAELLDVRMYDGLRATWRGWGRSLALDDVTAPLARALDVATVLAAQALPPLLLVARLARWRRPAFVDVAMTAVRLGTLVGTRRAYRRTGVAYWASWTADLPVALLLAARALRPARVWAGRDYGRATPA
jgi:dolichol-phosphate mannosyltransferase